MTDDPPSQLAQKFALNRILEEAVDNGSDAVFQVRWTGYGPDDDTWDPEAFQPAGMVARFRARMAKRRR